MNEYKLHEADYDNVKKILNLNGKLLSDYPFKAERQDNSLVIWWDGAGPTEDDIFIQESAKEGFFTVLNDFIFWDD